MHKWPLLVILLAACSAHAQDATEFRPPLELVRRLQARLPAGWVIKRMTDRPTKKELGWTLLPELYYIRLEGPKKWTLSHYSGPPLSPEEDKHLFDERAEFVDVNVYPNNPSPSKQLHLDPPITAVLWTTQRYQGLGCAPENFSWPTWAEDLKQVFAEVFPADASLASRTPTAEQTERAAVSTEFRKLAGKRADMQMRLCDDAARVEHVARLRALLDRANAVRDTSQSLLIHTELNRFGVTIPGEPSLHVNDAETVAPQVLRSPQTHTIYSLESDGRHVTAISPEGKIIWCRDPFADAGLEPYRFSKPVIRSFRFRLTARRRSPSATTPVNSATWMASRETSGGEARTDRPFKIAPSKEVSFPGCFAAKTLASHA